MRFLTPARKQRDQGEWMANAERDKPAPLSASEQEAGLAAVAKLKAPRDEMLQQRKGVLFGGAAEELDKLRAERTRQPQ